MQRLQDRCERRHTVWESAGRHQWRLSQLSSQDVTLPLLSDTVHCHPHLTVSLTVVGGWVVHLYDVLGLGTATAAGSTCPSFAAPACASTTSTRTTKSFSRPPPESCKVNLFK